MSQGTTFQVTHPNGTVSTRTSKTRTYTHAVILRTTEADAQACAADYRAHAAKGTSAASWYLAQAEFLDDVGSDGLWSVIAWSGSEANAVKAAGPWAKHYGADRISVGLVDGAQVGAVR